MPSPHLVVDLSSHGFGHVAQTAPVVNALRCARSELRLTLRGDFPRGVLASRFEGDFDLVSRANDVGMRMANAVDLLVEDSALAYRRFHADWKRAVEAEAKAIAELRPTAILANVPYLTCAAGRRADTPCFAMSSLNWAEIYGHYCGHLPEATEIRDEILAAYRSAVRFLRVEPGLPMSALGADTLHAVGPVAATGQNRRTEIDRRFNISAEERVVLVALGGIDTRLPMDDWEQCPGVRWLVPDAWRLKRPDTLAFESLEMPFLDLLASSDAVLTKPGYGTFVEAAANAVPVITVRRPDWPEEPVLAGWLSEHGRLVEVTREQMWSGDLHTALESAFGGAPLVPIAPTGVDEVVELLLPHLS